MKELDQGPGVQGPRMACCPEPCPFNSVEAGFTQDASCAVSLWKWAWALPRERLDAHQLSHLKREYPRNSHAEHRTHVAVNVSRGLQRPQKAGNIQRRGYPSKTRNMHLGIHATQSRSLKFITSKHTECDILQDIHMSCVMLDFCIWISVLLYLLFLFYIEED